MAIRETLDRIAAVDIESLEEAKRVQAELISLLPLRDPLLRQPDQLDELVDLLESKRNILWCTGDVWHKLLAGCKSARIRRIVKSKIDSYNEQGMPDDMKHLTALYLSLPADEPRNLLACRLIREFMSSDRTAFAEYAVDLMEGPAGGQVIDVLESLLGMRQFRLSAFQALCRVESETAHARAYRALIDQPWDLRFVAAEIGPLLSEAQVEDLIPRAEDGDHALVFLAVIVTAPDEFVRRREARISALIDEWLGACNRTQYLDFCFLASAFARSYGDQSFLDVLKRELDRAEDQRARMALENAVASLSERLAR